MALSKEERKANKDQDLLNMSKEQRKAYKERRRRDKQRQKLQKSRDKVLGVEKDLNNEDLYKEPPAGDTQITILCVRYGNKYGPEYVERLRNMVSRHLTIPYKFVCLTDDPAPIRGVELIVRKNQGYMKPWWHKVHMFDPELPLAGRILYLDLDVVICANIDKIAKFKTGCFTGIRDFNRKFHPTWRRVNSSVMSWNYGSLNHIWEEFKKSPAHAMRMHGDQDWVWKTSYDRVNFFPDEWIQSYKWEVRDKKDLTIVQGKRTFRQADHQIRPHTECSILVFHGDPNPCNVNDKFIVDNWK